MFKKTFIYLKKHKVITTIIVLALIGGGYFAYQKLTVKPTTVRYVLTTAEKGTLVSSVTGSGQVSVSNQVDLKTKASGAAVYINLNAGQDVTAGQLLVSLDTADAQKSVRDAQTNLETAQLALQKLQQPAGQLSIIQAQNSLAQATENKKSSEDDLVKAYGDGFNTVSNVFLDLPNLISGLDSTLHGNDINTNQENINYYTDNTYVYEHAATQYQSDAEKKYLTARAEYDQNFIDYKATSRSADTVTIEALINQTYQTTKNLSDAIKSANNLIQLYKDTLTARNLKTITQADTALTNLNSYTSKINTHLSNLLSATNAISTDKQNIINYQRSIEEKTQSLADLQADLDPLELRSQQITIQQRQNALADARQTLADYYVRAPFAGTIAKVDIVKGDSPSSGTVVGTLITKQRLAEITLNEVDAAKVAVGQKATLTFDAIPDLSITGEVAEVDTLGTVAQGVVSYTIKINLDTQDERIKPGMTVSAAIITKVKPDVLLVANSAVKSSNGQNYVEMPNETAMPTISSSGITLTNDPKQQIVEIGTASDSQTEITSGLTAGDVVITRTISATTTTTSAAGSSANRSILGNTGSNVQFRGSGF